MGVQLLERPQERRNFWHN